VRENYESPSSLRLFLVCGGSALRPLAGDLEPSARPSMGSMHFSSQTQAGGEPNNEKE
jgi:hypothetical protein